jgi:non-specific serine/threonine protein kinase
MTLKQISARLNPHPLALSGGARTSLLRHRELRAAMEWSYQFLPEAEKLN